MNKVEKLKKILKQHKSELEHKYNVKEIGIFGSYVRQDEKKRSDLDILVEFDDPPGLFKFIELEDYLSKILKIEVDLVRKKALKPYIGKHILEEVEYI